MQKRVNHKEPNDTTMNKNAKRVKKHPDSVQKGKKCTNTPAMSA